MVAPRSRPEPQSGIAQIESEARIARLTVEQVEGMLAAGILADGAPIELIDGVLVYKNRSDRGEDPRTIGKKHSLGVKLLGRLDPDLERHGCHMQTQNPVRIPPHDEPEPDGAVLRGQPRDYTDQLPGAPDVYAVIEVADASLDYDRTAKLALYARAGIAQYIIVNLRLDCVEVYERPAAGEYRYESVTVLRRGETLALSAGTETRIDFDVARLLP
jgi:Uma2 family endonuclease